MVYQKIPLQWVFKFWRFWPPFFGAGILVEETTDDLRFVRVRLKLRFWNRNYVGTQFGGSLFAMTDAIHMLMLLQALGPGYIVWDKAASIRYVKPGKSDVTAEFGITDEILEHIRSTLKKQEKMDWKVTVQVLDRNAELIAEVERVLYIRLKAKA
jgi:acyl-coenzyme A thioesterase PaaI-like protein